MSPPDTTTTEIRPTIAVDPPIVGSPEALSTSTEPGDDNIDHSGRSRLLMALLPTAGFVILVGFFATTLVKEQFFGHNPAELPSAMIDKPAPDFDLPAVADDKPGLATTDLKGAPHLVNFFASWCVPCQQDHAMLNGFAASGRIPIDGIAYKDKLASSKRFLANLGDPYERIGDDAEGRTAIDFGLYGVPETYIVDAAGEIRYRWVGPLTPEGLEHEILPRLAALQSK
jgi:cytochrome c biogenesis protein CcmG/thiol:disulfide interchange protein DsbE